MSLDQDSQTDTSQQSDFDKLISEIKYLPPKKLTKSYINRIILSQGLHVDPSLALSEVMRLTGPCHKTLDFRWKLKGVEVGEINILEKVHFVDKWTAKFLIEEIKKYGLRYTQGAYEAAKVFFRDNRKLLVNRQKEVDTPIDMLKFCGEFKRSEERMFFAKTVSLLPLSINKNSVDYEAQEDDMQDKVDAVTSNISKSALKLRMEKDIGATQFVVVRFDSLEQELVFSQSNIIYKVIKKIKHDENHSYEYILELQPNECNKEFAHYLKNLIFSHKHKYKVDLNGITDSAYSKVCENYFINASEQIDFFVDKNGDLKYVLEHFSHQFCARYFGDGIEQVVANIIRHHKLTSCETTFLFCTRGTKSEISDNSQVTLISSLFDSRKPDEFYASIAQYGKAKSSKLFKVVVSKVLANRAFRTSSIPKESQEIYGSTRINRHSESTKKSIAQCAWHVSVHPIDHYGISTQINNSKTSLAPNTNALTISSVNNPQYKHVFRETDEKRTEDRFNYVTAATLEFNGRLINGTTVDVSSLGLCVKLDQNADFPEGATVTVSFSKLADRTTIFDLNRCKYNVVKYSDGHVHLSNKAFSSHDGKEFWHKFISSKLEQITKSKGQEGDYGISRALNNIAVSSYADNVLFYKQMNKRPLATVFIESGLEKELDDFVIDEQSVRTWFYHPKIYPILTRAHEKLFEKHKQSHMFLSINFHRTLGGEVIEDINITLADTITSDTESFIDASKVKAREQLIFHLVPYKATNQFCRYNTDELNYIKHFAPHKSEELLTKIKDVKGMFIMTDITQLFA
ncbi:MAG: hypothetical protein Alis3KO_10890 [Aliiglaciecola sp.]